MVTKRVSLGLWNRTGNGLGMKRTSLEANKGKENGEEGLSKGVSEGKGRRGLRGCRWDDGKGLERDRI